MMVTPNFIDVRDNWKRVFGKLKTELEKSESFKHKITNIFISVLYNNFSLNL